MFMKVRQLLRACLWSMLMVNIPILSASASEIITIYSVAEAEPYLACADQQTLILFDIDYTLTTPTDPYWQLHAIQHHNQIFQKYVSALTPNQTRIFKHLFVLKGGSSQLVEKAWPQVIKNLQKRKVKTLALTASKTGAVGNLVFNFPYWRFCELYRLGIDFSSTFEEARIFDDLEDFGGDHPGIEKGIVCSGHKIPKGQLLSPIFETLKWMPTTIIIDDKLENIISCKIVLESDFPSIKFIGIHYKGIEKFPVTVTDPSIFEEKLCALIKQTKILCPQ